MTAGVSLHKIRAVAIILSFGVLSAGVGYWWGQHRLSLSLTGVRPTLTVVNRGQPLSSRNVDFSLFWRVWDELGVAYLEPSALDAQKMVFGAISGMTASVGDPYTIFLSPTENTQTQENLSGSFF